MIGGALWSFTLPDLNYFTGTATLDLTHSDMEIFTKWRNRDFVYVLFTIDGSHPTPDPAALNVFFVSAYPTAIPAGVAATNVVLTQLVPIETGGD
jgi:hypothetical protein